MKYLIGIFTGIALAVVYSKSTKETPYQEVNNGNRRIDEFKRLGSPDSMPDGRVWLDRGNGRYHLGVPGEISRG